MEKMQKYVVQETTDYGMFKILDENRVVNPTKVQKMMKSFVMTNGMSKSKPITVNSKMEVIDGQHRLQACKELSIPVYFMVTDDNAEVIPVFNQFQERWGLNDYARFFAKRGNENYQRLLDIEEKVPCEVDGILNILGMITGGTGNEAFKEGRFIFNRDVDECIKEINDMLEFVFLIKGKRLVNKKITRAYKFIQKINGFDKDEFIRKIKAHPGRIHGCDTSEEYIDMFVDIYNYHSSKNVIDEVDVIAVKKSMKNIKKKNISNKSVKA